jgi:ribonuclease Y
VSVPILLALLVVLAAAGLLLGRRVAHRQAEAFSAGVRAVVDAIGRAAAAERTASLRAAELGARDEARALASANETFCQVREAELEQRARRVDSRRAELAAMEPRVAETQARLEATRERAAQRDEEARRLREEIAAARVEARTLLAQTAGESTGSAIDSLRDADIEEARLAAVRAERAAVEHATETAGRFGKRVMGIAMGRFYGHYLTERLLSVIPILPGAAGEALIGPDEANLRAIGAVAGVTLTLGEHRDAIRLEGLDGVGREVARRTIARLLRDPRQARDATEVTRLARELAGALDGELDDLGRRAFATLEIPPAHAEIVKLVGRLNYRTSYTQNQWKHAVEAAFLCGMMAAELGLDTRIARRAALMHDIGKALTHELDGSHAVIGADYARRLGEAEVVANAIGAHHTDEPFGSAYAYLVAAADALSGARPGARRQTDDNYLSRIDDLERITRGFPGVDEAFAVQGGREVRVYVREDRVDDVGAVGLSTAIAEKISHEMRFPGQIRVTVIRELRAEEIAS